MDYKDMMKSISDRSLLASGLIGYIDGISSVRKDSDGIKLIRIAIDQYKKMRC